MIKDLETKLRKWDDPLSNSEENICQSAIRTIRRIIDNCEILKGRDIEIFEQGSHANKTNVRNNSDVDIGIICRQTFYYTLPPYKNKSDYGIYDSPYTYDQFKMEVFQVLAKQFNVSEIDYGKKAFKIEHFKYNDSYLSVDVVPFFEYREYGQNGVKNVGVSLIDSQTHERVINYPKQHIDNSVAKNARTNHYYKRMVRCFKSLKYDLEDEGYDVKDVKSFVLESILYNLDDDTYNMENAQKSLAGRYMGPYSAMFYNCIQYAKNLLLNSSAYMYEPNEILKLFNDASRNPQTYINFLELLESYCFQG